MKNFNVPESVSFLLKPFTKISKMIHFLCCFLFKYCAGYKKNKPKMIYTIPITKTKKLELTDSELELYLNDKI